MTALTPDAVLRLIRDEVVAALGAVGASASRCTIVDDFGLQLSSDLMIQVRPAGGTNELPNVGIGLVTERVEIVTWVREYKDEGGKLTLAIAGASNRSLLRKVGIALGALINNTLDDRLVVCLKFISNGAVRRDPKVPNYIGQPKIFSYSYEPDYSVAGSATSVYMGFDDAQPDDVDELTSMMLGDDTLLDRGIDDDPNYVWCLATYATLVFRSNLGVQPFYSPASEPPDGPACGTVTIAGVQFNRFRSAYPTAATEVTYSASLV